MILLRVGERTIGDGSPCFIIAEAGVNHNGSLELARKLVDAAADTGADAVKFQTWVTEDVMEADALLAGYQASAPGARTTQFQMAKELELDFASFEKLQTRARERGIIFFSTPDEEKSADFLDGLDVPLFKIGSAEVTNIPLLHHIARKGRPIILSTGMADLGDVAAAVRAIEQEGDPPLALLHCVSTYPAEPRDCNLRAMDTLRAAFRRPVGFSDHTLGEEIALAAVARGACIIEKHLTLDRSLRGPDHRASLEPDQFTCLVQGIRAVELALGDGVKRPVPAEGETKAVTVRRLVAREALHAGDVITMNKLALRRTSAGLDVSHLPLVLGRRLRRTVAVGQALTADDLS